MGNIAIARDWGWAPEYVKAMYLMLQQPQPDDYVIATGNSYKLEEFVAEAFACVGLDWREHTITSPSLFRPTDLAISRANPAKAKNILGWEAQYKMPDIVKMMISARLNQV